MNNEKLVYSHGRLYIKAPHDDGFVNTHNSKVNFLRVPE